MNATPSAPWSTSRRVDACSTWPGHGEDLDAQAHRPIPSARSERPDARKTSGSMSKKSVRSSFVSSVMRRPRTLLGRELVERAEVRRLPAERRAVIDELYSDLAAAEVDLHGRRPEVRARE
jgi:hypothetical protein